MTSDNLAPTPVSVIIPAYNAGATIGACLRALARQTYVQPYEVIVVDDGCEDETADIARAAGVQVISIPRSRPAAARNVGIAAATGDIICCTDADCEPADDWLEQITLPLQDLHITACKGTYATRQTSLVARFVQLEYEDKYDLMAGEATIDFIDTYSAAYRKSDLVAIGGFNESFAYLEDQELSFRLAGAGHPMVFQPSAVVYHRHAASLWAYFRKKITIGYWKAQVVRAFPDKLVRDSHTPQIMKVQILLAAMLLTGTTLLCLSLLLNWSTPIRSASSMVIALTIILFLATTLGFVRKAWSKDRAVALVAPALLFVRALGLGIGTLQGLLQPPSRVQPPDKSVSPNPNSAENS